MGHACPHLLAEINHAPEFPTPGKGRRMICGGSVIFSVRGFIFTGWRGRGGRKCKCSGCSVSQEEHISTYYKQREEKGESGNRLLDLFRRR